MRRFAFVLALFIAGHATAAEPFERSFHARAQVGVDGKVGTVEPQEGLPPSVADVVRESVAAVEFEPATVNGEPTESTTTLWVRLHFEPGPGDALATTVVSVDQSNPFTRIPTYPEQAMRNGHSAKVMLRLALLPDGSVDMANSAVDSIEVRDSNWGRIDNPRAGAAMAKAAMEAARDWRIFPEEVAGVAQSTVVLTPVTFCVAKRGRAPNGCREFDPSTSEGRRQSADPGVRLPALRDAPATPEA
ncbi:MAG TPA: TonB family protein [Arenimonas sp.]|uniref:TonB family protein n=1 Tax=Arenimonas sp. TaxID=1872635 RepID=UPI002D7EC648|nr:TonB family protein [Arenimonas sp.]HEU0152500.1 TonB family protein [Arenimonas sp.]